MITQQDRAFMAEAFEASKMSTCFRPDRKIGAVYVVDGKIVARAANCSPEGIKPCTLRGECLRQKLQVKSGTRLEICYANCAEMTGIINASKEKISLQGATLYCTHKPCSRCARIMIGAGIKRVVYSLQYPDDFSNELFKEANVALERIE